MQFIDLCSFITPQIKFGNPASAVMYYKGQMGGRERESETEKMKGKEADREGEAWLTGGKSRSAG